MKKSLALLAAIGLTGCSLTQSPSAIENIDPANGTDPSQSLNEAVLMLGDHQVSLQLPEGLAAKNPEWEARPTMIIIAQEDMIDTEGDFFFHSITLKEDQQVELEKSFLESYYQDYAPLTVEIAGKEYERILYTNEFTQAQSVVYLQQNENDILHFSPANNGLPNEAEDLELIQIIEGFELES